MSLASEGLRVYPAKKWKGQALLVCGKCERKLKGSDDAVKVKKVLKKLAKGDLEPVEIQVIRVGCMDLCPKRGVAVCTQAGLRMTPPGLNILWSKGDVRAMYEEVKSQSEPGAGGSEGRGELGSSGSFDFSSPGDLIAQDDGVERV